MKQSHPIPYVFYERLQDNLKRLKLIWAAEVLDTVAAHSEDGKVSYLSFLDHLLEEDVAAKEKRPIFQDMFKRNGFSILSIALVDFHDAGGIMADLKIALVYFSATNVTHTYAQVIRDRLLEQGCDVKLLNVTGYASRQKPTQIDGFNGIIFGFPVFADFAPSVINEWLPTLNGQGTKCVQYFTYGARTTGYAHFHTKLLLEKAGFQVLFSAEFLGRHSFNVGGWRILPDRPNQQDFAIAIEYADSAVEHFWQEKPAVFNLQKPFGYNRVMASLRDEPKRKVRGWRHPVRTTNECSMCRDCETECPAQAFDADTGLSEPEKCIECMRCVYICPDKVLRVDECMKGDYDRFLAAWHLTEEMMNAKKSRIITEAWQAAS